MAAFIPGLALCIGISLVALAVQAVEVRIVGRPYIEAIVGAILLGTLIRTLWTPGQAWAKGTDFSAKTLLEIAVALLGASISAQAIATHGLGLLLGVAVVVIVSLAASYAVGRSFGLSRTLALLVACGNSICGNSAIAAVAPIIDAEADDIVSSIAFTAILGVIVVLVLPLLVPLLQLSQRQYGVLAGLTVYAVPQVLAATFPIGIVSTQIGTLVKLMRVLMLGPVVLLLSIGVNRSRPDIGDRARLRAPLPLSRFLPWFIIAFVLLAGLRSLGLVPLIVLGPIVQLAALLTVVAMAALGLSVDMRGLRRAGGRVIAAALVAVLLLGAISFVLIYWLRIT
ncbi:MAG TPA: putative sulfate exporter family transporter [Stellaceae bacterium]|nr:putative sulfate exporter family transporter [Stellaceae bacterium]